MLILPDAQGSPEWLASRFGTPSASNFSRIITSAGKPSASLAGYAAELAAEVFADKSLDTFDGTVWMNRGIELEAEAIALYAFQNDIEPQTTGFIKNYNAGCTPDALIGDDGLLEVKCLKAERHVAAVSYFQKHKRAPTDYLQQTQGQLWITGRKWNDLIFYHPEMPLLVIRQMPDLAVFEALKAGVDEVCRLRNEMVADLRRQQQFIPEPA